MGAEAWLTSGVTGCGVVCSCRLADRRCTGTTMHRLQAVMLRLTPVGRTSRSMVYASGESQEGGRDPEERLAALEGARRRRRASYVDPSSSVSLPPNL